MNKILLVSVFLIGFLTLTAVCAADENSTDTQILEVNDNVQIDSADEILGGSEAKADLPISEKDIEEGFNIRNGKIEKLYAMEEVFIPLPEKCNYTSFNLYIDDEALNYTYFIDDQLDYIHGGYESFSDGNHTLKFEFLGNKYYNPCTKMIDFEVVPYSIYMPTQNNYKYIHTTTDNYMSTPSISVDIFEEYLANITLYVDGKVHQIKNNTYREYLSLESLSCGIHEIELKIDIANKSTISKKKNMTIDYEIGIDTPDYFFIENSNNYFTVMLPGKIAEKVTVYVDGKKCIMTKYNYKIKAKISNPTLGKHTIVVKCSGDSIFPKKSFQKNIKVVHRGKIKGSKTVYMYYGENKKINYEVYGISGKLTAKQLIFFTLNHDYFQGSYSNKKGIASYKVPNVKPGKYSLYVGVDSNSKPELGFKTIETKVIIKHVVSLKTVKVQKSAKELVLQSSLKKGKTPLKYKQVTFQFNGKTFKAKTDKNGVAKVTIKSSILKKLKAGNKVTYQAKYGKDIVKKTAKIYK